MLPNTMSHYTVLWSIRLSADSDIFNAGQRKFTFVVRQQVEERLSDLLAGQWLNVLQAVQQRPNGIILSLSVNRSHSVPVRKLAFSQEVQDVPLLVEITVTQWHRLTVTHPQNTVRSSFVSCQQIYHKFIQSFLPGWFQIKFVDLLCMIALWDFIKSDLVGRW